MIELLSVGLKKVGPFKDVSFTFKHGLNVIYGLNQAEGVHSSNGNAAGKSFLLSAPAEILYEDPIIGEKQDRVKEGTRFLSFKNAKGQVVDVQREGSGRMSIVVDGKNVTPRAAAARKQLLKKLLPISQDKYNTYVHVDARKPHPLVMGTSAERKRFFTSFFPLGQFDQERKLYQAELLRLKKVKAVYVEVRDQFKKAKKDLLSPEERKKLKAKIQEVDTQLATLVQRQSEASETKQVVDFLQSSKDDVKRVLDGMPQGEELTHDLFEEKYKQRVDEYEYDQRMLKRGEEWLEWYRENEKYQKKLSALSTKAQKAIDKYGSAKKAVKALSKKLDALREEERQWDKVHDKLDDLKKEIRSYDLSSKPAKPEGYTDDTSDIQTLLATYEHQLKHAEKFSEGKCEYCGSNIKIKDPSELRKKIKKLKQQLEDFKEYRQYRKDKKAVDELGEQLVDLTKQKGKLEHVPAAISTAQDVYNELKNLPDSPGKYEGKHTGKTPGGVDQIRLRMEYAERTVKAFDFVRPYIKLLQRAMTMTTEEQKKAEKILKKDLTTEIQDLQDKVAGWKAKMALHKTMKENALALRTRLRKLKKEVVLIEPLKKLVEGFQDKNVKRMAIEALSQSLMQQVNHYSKMVFPEDYRFSFDWSASQVSILVHRRMRGKSAPATDVRKLSGAESKLFTLILILSLMTYVPKKERASVLILDEPAANFHEETHARFMKLLPLIQKIIPTVVIITPKHNEVYQGARNFTVHKVDGIATIHKGHPSELMKSLRSTT